MGFDPKNAVNAAKDIATHAVEKAADIVEDSMDIATHAAGKAKEAFTGKSDTDDA